MAALNSVIPRRTGLPCNLRRNDEVQTHVSSSCKSSLTREQISVGASSTIRNEDHSSPESCPGQKVFKSYETLAPSRFKAREVGVELS